MYRRDVTAFPGGLREALQQNVPVHVPAGIYYLDQADGQIVLNTNADIEGDGDTTEIRVRGTPLKGGLGKTSFANLKITGAQTTDCLLSYDGVSGDVPGFSMLDIIAEVARFVTVSDYLDDQGLAINEVTLSGLIGHNQKSPIELQGAIRHHDLTGITLEDFKERGITIGSGRRSGQLRMESGTVAGLYFARGIPSGNASNNYNLWHGGRNVEISDVVIEDWPNVQKPNGSWHQDNEALYTKVDGLTIWDVQLLRVGGSLGAWSTKGAHPANETWEIDGRNTTAENFVIDGTGVVGPKTALWMQCYGSCTHAKFKVISCSGVGYRMHTNCDGAYTMREWDVWDHGVPTDPSNPGFVYRAGVGSLNVQGCTLPTRDGLPWYRENPVGLSFTEAANRRLI